MSYISGYVVKMCEKKLHHCKGCSQALTEKDQEQSCFVSVKDRGGLKKASKSVTRICNEADACLTQMMKVSGGRPPSCQDLPRIISTAVLNNLSHVDLFPSLRAHMFDTNVCDNHIFSLTKLVAQCYSKIKLYHIGKQFTKAVIGPTCRSLTKLILFKGDKM